MTPRFALAVVGRAHEAALVAASAGATLAAAAQPRAALVVALGSGTHGPVGRGTPAATRLAVRLADRGLPARASGRVAWCQAADAADAGHAAAFGVPTVLAVCGPREAWTDELLGDAGLVLVAGAPEAPLTVLALSALRDLGVDAAAVAPPTGLASGLARLGVPAPGVRLPLAPPAARRAS